jgi:hypothetical protein
MASNNSKRETASKQDNAFNSTASNAIARGPLQKLPNEILDQIYEHALRLDNDAKVEVREPAGISEPALLFTCKEIRRNAIKIFYLVNVLCLHIYSFSPSTVMYTHKKDATLRRQYNCKIKTITGEIRGPRSWSNLISWLRYTHGTALKAPSIDLSPHPSVAVAHFGEKEEAVIAGLFHMVHVARDAKWDQVEQCLDLMRYGLAACNKDWAQD